MSIAISKVSCYHGVSTVYESESIGDEVHRVKSLISIVISRKRAFLGTYQPSWQDVPK